jgi:putative ABC transport system permease protein
VTSLAPRKLAANPGMTACLLVGAVCAVALLASIPLYTDGILQRLLTRDLQSFQVTTGLYPGIFTMGRYFFAEADPAARVSDLRSLDRDIERTIIPSLGIPTVARTRMIELSSLQLLTPGTKPGRGDEGRSAFVRVEALDGLIDHARIVAGRAFTQGSTASGDGVLEGMISEKALKDAHLYLDQVYDVWNPAAPTARLVQVRIVGVYAPRDTADPWWYRTVVGEDPAVMIDFGAMGGALNGWAAGTLSYARWYAALDYQSLAVAGLGALTTKIADWSRAAQAGGVEWELPLAALISDYAGRSAALRLVLWFLQVPVLLMLVVFISMVARLVIESDANEIAVLKSRGARTRQVFLVYLAESAILAAAALAVGLPAALALVRVLGSTSGFLRFVDRAALRFVFSLRPLAWAGAGVLLFMLSMLAPALTAARESIVEFKQHRAQAVFRPFWKKLYLDVVLLAVSLAGVFSYGSLQSVIRVTGVEGSRLPMDPLLFVVSTAFILGGGLLFLRVYPLLVRWVFGLGRPLWPPVIYAAFTRVGRSFRHEQFLMIFLVMSLGLGVYGAVTARTVNLNAEEQVRYAVGADVVLQPKWENRAAASVSAAGSPSGVTAGGASTLSAAVVSAAPQWVEPPFFAWQQLAGVERATKVLDKTGVAARFDSGSRQVALLGIVPSEFGRVAWFRSDLLSRHWFAYLNLLAGNPRAMLISADLRDAFNLRLGDVVTLSWPQQSAIDGFIAGIVDYWPTYNAAASTDGVPSALVVANLEYLQARSAVEPYQVWLKKSPGATSRQVYQSIQDKGLEVVSLVDADQQIIERRNDPSLEGTNGMLTLGFLITMGVAFAGFLVYWVLSLRARTLPFGVMRAMGLPQGSIIGMLVFEQVLLSVAAMAVGIVLGAVASAVFVPFLQLSAGAAGQVPPFRVVFLPRDLGTILAAGGVMLVTGGVLFRWMIGRISVGAAVKLGEE